jgi:hypothetical protein
MKFDLKKPCSNCPFLRTDGAIRLRAGRVRDIHNVVTASQGGSFPCHKTVRDEDRDDTDDEDEDDEGGFDAPEPHWQWCAGALIYALKLEQPNQLMRIASRLGLLDADPLLASEAANDVFDSREEWLRSTVDYDEDENEEIETCHVVNDGCDAPAGYLAGDGVVEGDIPADYVCYHCGQAVCGPCSSMIRGKRTCSYCKEDEEGG